MTVSGCVQILIGVKAIEDQIKGMGNKQASQSQVMAAIEEIQKLVSR
jgi:hypothetical protein